MKVSILALSTLALSTAAAAQTVEVGQANWENFPRLKLERDRLAYEAMVPFVAELIKKEQCRFEGQSARRFDVTIPYMVQLQPDGKISRVLVSDAACEPLESLVGRAAIRLGETGAIRSPAPSEPRWYASEINFTLE